MPHDRSTPPPATPADSPGVPPRADPSVAAPTDTRTDPFPPHVPPTVPYPDQTTLHALFSEQARLRPDAVALATEAGSWTYAALERASNQLAHRLLRLGVRPEQPVALLLDRSVRLVVAILACLKASAVYAPLATEYPVARLRQLLRDSKAPLLLTAGHPPPGLDVPGLHVVDLDAPPQDEPESRRFSDLPDAPPDSTTGPTSPAYLMYTSGSTGVPKGVLVPHRAVIRLVCGTTFLPWHHDLVFLLLAPPSFDASTLELWGPLLHGARCVIYPSRHVDPTELRAVLERHRVSCLWLTASLFDHLVDLDPLLLAPVRYLLTGGEALSVPHVRRALAALPSTQLINGYGPTESTTFACTHAIPRDSDPAPTGSIPIGKPIANTRCFVLDPSGRPVPIGTPGELYIGGDGLALGYLHQPELTAERFVPDPFSPPRPDGRLYRTGDRCRWLPDGTLEFLGRIDDQLKIRGFRVEPAEVAACLESHPSVRRAVVLPRSAAGHPASNLELVAFFVPGPEPAPPPAALREFLRERLPDAFVPRLCIPVASFPIGPNGKLDRDALLSLVEPSTHEPPSPPATSPVERSLRAIWANLLRQPSIGVHDDFFELGGHSLLAMRVVSAATRELGIDIPVRWIFELRTVAQLADRLAHCRTTRPDAIAVPSDVAGSNLHPPSKEQERLWFLDQTLTQPAVYNVPCAVRLEGPFDLETLDRAFRRVARRHDLLRSRFVNSDGQPRIETVENAFPLPRLVQASETATRQSPETESFQDAWLREQTLVPFQLDQAPLWRWSCLRLDDCRHVLLIVAHHAICDEWSLPVWLADLSAAYASEAATHAPSASTSSATPPAPAPKVQYADYVAWQAHQLQDAAVETHRDYWRHHLAGAPPGLPLALDHPRSAALGARGGRIPVVCPAHVRHSLRSLAAQEGSTPFMLVLAAFHATLFHLTGTRDLVVGAPLAHRHRPEFESLIGFFVNTVPIRARLSDDTTFRDLLRTVRRTTLDAFEHGITPFDEIVRLAGVPRILGQTPLLGAVCVWLSQPADSLRLPGVQTEVLRPDPGLAKFDLTLFMSEGPRETWIGYLEYHRDLFEADTARHIVRALASVMERVAANPDHPIASLVVASTGHTIRATPPTDQDSPVARPGSAAEPPTTEARSPLGNPTHAVLAPLWASLLHRPAVGVHEDFFELGGHSILAMRLVFEIRRVFGKAIAITDLFRAPTIALLSEILDRLRPLETAFKGTGTAPPLFFVPGIPGINYLPPCLTERLGTVTRYHDSLQYPGVDGLQPPSDDVAQLADHLLQRLIEVWPSGPVRLAGYSLGGTVALEMARRLDATGRRPELLLLLDAAAPDALRPRSFARAVVALLRHLARLPPRAAVRFLVARLAGKFHTERAKRIAELGLVEPESAAVTPAEAAPTVSIRQRVFDASFRAAAAYRPTAYPGPAVLIRTDDELAFGAFREMDAFNGWAGVIQGGVQVLPISGDHWQLFQEPSVHALADRIVNCLERLAASPRP